MKLQNFIIILVISILVSMVIGLSYLVLDLFTALELSMKMNMDFLQELIPFQTDPDKIKEYTMTFELFENYFTEKNEVDPLDQFSTTPKVLGGN